MPYSLETVGHYVIFKLIFLRVDFSIKAYQGSKWCKRGVKIEFLFVDVLQLQTFERFCKDIPVADEHDFMHPLTHPFISLQTFAAEWIPEIKNFSELRAGLHKST